MKNCASGCVSIITEEPLCPSKFGPTISLLPSGSVTRVDHGKLHNRKTLPHSRNSGVTNHSKGRDKGMLSKIVDLFRWCCLWLDHTIYLWIAWMGNAYRTFQTPSTRPFPTLSFQIGDLLPIKAVINLQESILFRHRVWYNSQYSFLLTFYSWRADGCFPPNEMR